MRRERVKRCQIKQSVLILKATGTTAVGTAVAAHADVAATEAQAARIAATATDRTGPVAAAAACEVDRAIAEVAGTRRNKP